MKKISTPVIALILLFILSCNVDKSPADYVNPFIGTGGHGHTFPGATVPFGMVQLSPDTRLEGWDGCSGYHYTDSIIYGFSHTHLSGTGVGDYADILLMPMSGEYKLFNGYKDLPKNGYASYFDKKTERASAGFYQVTLADYDIDVQLTSTERVGFHKYSYLRDQKAFVVIDLTHRDYVIESSLEQISETEIAGMRRSQAWARDQYVYFVARFSQPIKVFNLAINDTVQEDITSANERHIKAALDFGELPGGDELLVKVGISTVSIEGARKNLDAEIKDWNFDDIKNRAKEKWNEALGKIKIKATEEQKEIFYTSLYHSMIAPNLFMDVDGQYRGTDLEVHQADGFTNYTIFSLWDTYRATHPLYTIIEQERTNDFIRTFINQYKNGGQLPVWELAGNYTGCMIGYHSIPVIADAYLKGIRDYDAEKAFEAMKHSAMQDHLGLESYRQYGFIPADKESESVSKTLEYAYDDWCIAQMAKSLDKTEDYSYYLKRAQSFKNIFDPGSGFMRAKLFGAWKYPFDPSEVDFNYTEANSWQYSFYVPQDVTGLYTLLGGKDELANKLDALFAASSETTGRHQSDITGLIGQYAHGNEPSHHMAYLYNYVNQPWKTQEITRQIMDELYSIQPDGLSGNEDCGQMSSWYVLSAMGFYPVTPASDIYAIGTPILKESTIYLEKGNQFMIKAKGVSQKNIYIQSVSYNGDPYEKSYISHQMILDGGILEFKMGASPNKEWGSSNENIPVSYIDEGKILPVPYSNAKSRSFVGSTLIELFSHTEETQIYFTLDGTTPSIESRLYTEPIVIDQSTVVKYFAIKEGWPASNVVELQMVKFPEGRNITLNTSPGSQYTGGNDSALIDGIFGDKDFRLGSWQGYSGKNLDAVIDLGKSTKISYLSANFLQDINSWIFMPQSVQFYISSDGENFVLVGTVENKVPEDEWGVILKDFTINVYPKQVRYVKVIGKSMKFCPEWHKGAGNESWIFVDEITVK